MEEHKSLRHPRPIKTTKAAALRNATAADGRVTRECSPMVFPTTPPLICCWLSPPLSGNIAVAPRTDRGKSSTEVSFGPHHTLEGVGRVGSLFQQLAVLQLLAHPLQGVERLVELHGHLHFGELFADVVPEDVP